MRKFIGFAMIFGILTAIPSLLSADDPFETYMQLVMNNHYFLDNQGVNRVSCRVVLSALNPVKLRDQLKPFADKVTLKGKT